MRRSSGRSLVNGLIFAALAAEFIALAGHALFHWGNKTYPPTPRTLVFAPPAPPSGSDMLLRLSAVAASQSSPPWPADRPYAYVQVRSWALRVHGGRGKVAAVTSVTSRTRAQVPALSSSHELLAGLISAGSRAGGWAPGWSFVDLARLTRARPVPGAAQAILLQMLSAVPGVVNEGSTIDRAGRPGAAVSLDSSYDGEPITYTLVFSPATGALLEFDETLSDQPHRLNALKGSVVAYTTFLRSGYTTSSTAAP